MGQKETKLDNDPDTGTKTMRNTLPIVCFLFLSCFLSHASAHYLWVTTNNSGDAHGKALIYFEESPSAGDGHYLDHFAKTSKTWFRTVENIKPQLMPVEDIRQNKKRWLSAKLPATAPRSVDCYGKFGVYAYGETKVLLYYYARKLDVSTHEDLHELGRAKHMNLDIVPHDHEDEVELTVLWQGKPAENRMVFIRGPKQFRKNIKTNAKGRVRFTPSNAGKYTFRTSVEEATPGREGDEDYSLIRHNGTLIMTLPLNK
jgi:uncharacterized GH25 family protein